MSQKQVSVGVELLDGDLVRMSVTFLRGDTVSVLEDMSTNDFRTQLQDSISTGYAALDLGIFYTERVYRA